MIDIKLIRENPKLIKKSCKNRNYEIDIDALLKLDEKYRSALQKTEKLKSSRNKIAQEINELKKAGQDIKAKIKEVKEVEVELYGLVDLEVYFLFL